MNPTERMKQITELKHTEKLLRYELQLLRNTLAPELKKGYDLSQRIWAIAKQKLDLQKEHILEEASKEKQVNGLEKELLAVKKKYGEDAYQTIIEMLQDQEEE